MDLRNQIVQAFTRDARGLCGQHDPVQVLKSVQGVEQRLGLITLGSVLNTNPLSREQWAQLVALSEHWLMQPEQVAYQSSQQVKGEMEQMKLPVAKHIPRVWWQISRGVQGRFNGSWREMIRANRDDARKLKNYLQQNRTTFPVLAGAVISVRWLDLVHRVGGVPLQGWEALTVPVPASLKKRIAAFDIDDAVHPVLFNALHVWVSACQQLSSKSCGFHPCPKKQ